VIIIADSSALVSLSICNSTSLLEPLFGEIYVPTAVYDLYTSLSADLLLIDDAKAKKVAYLNGMEVMGSLGVLLMAKRHKLLPKIKPLLDLLSVSDIYFGDSILKKVQKLAGE
jgi:uncharacterized protein